MELLSRAEEIILIAVYKQKGDAYGVTIREQIARDIGRYWSFGVIYKTLNKMAQKRFVRKIAGEPLAERGGRSRYYYELTPSGLEVLEEIHRIQVALWNEVRPISLRGPTEP